MCKFLHQKSVLWAGMLALMIGTSAPLTFSASAQDAVVSAAPPIPLKPMQLPAHSPAPYGATPSPAQIQWHEMETYAFLHFGLNTFTGKEWGYGDESEKLFNPVDFDANKIVGELKAAGFKGVIIVAKHHDGFCLWPSKYTAHSVKNSPWKDGKGDVLRDLSDACRKADMKFGVYLSPWDRNRADYGTPAYVAYYHNQLREVLSNYGEIFMVWMDGANGGDGYYGGAREKRSIDARTYYGMDEIRKIVATLQPNAVIFGDDRADIRWIGNEAGQVPDTVWETFARGQNNGVSGTRGGELWHPAEVDVSIRPGWFYHASEDARVKTPQQLIDIYFNAVGHGCDLNLNFPPNQQGLLGVNDTTNARAMRRILDETFATNLVAQAKVSASATRTGDFAAANVLDARRDTFWAAPDGVKTAELTFETAKPITFDVVLLQEVIELGQRLDGFSLDAWENNDWHEVLKQRSVGYKRLDRLATPVTTTKVRLRLNAPVAPVLASFGLYLQPVTLNAPKITLDKSGLVTVGDGRAIIRYTLDGSDPTAAAPRFDRPVALPYGGTIKARVFGPQGELGEVATATFGVSKAKWKIVAVTAEVGPATNAIDDNPNTLWQTHALTGEIAPPQSITVDMGETLYLKGFTYLPRQDGTPRGMVTQGRFEISNDGQTWTTAWHGEFSNVAANPILQTIIFAAPQNARYFRFTGEKVAAANHVAVAELGVLVQ
jgi:alpha-L-fucosidase